MSGFNDCVPSVSRLDRPDDLIVKAWSSRACYKLCTTKVPLLRYDLNDLQALLDAKDTLLMLYACLLAIEIAWLDAEATHVLLDAFWVASLLIELEDSALLTTVDDRGRLRRWTNSAGIVTRPTFPYFFSFFPHGDAQ